MLKNTLLLFVALISLQVAAQNGTASPYSYYGIGELKFKGTVENKNMGGINVFADSIHLNLQNPAALGKLKLTTFTVGGNQNFTDLNTSSDKASSATTTIDYVALGLPMGKLAMSFGLMPYSSVGYKTGFTDHQTAEVGDGRYTGSGGVNKVFIAAGYNLFKDFSVGVDVNYSFGEIKNEAAIITGGQYNTQETNTSKLSGLGVNFGAHYTSTLSKKLQLTTSATYSPIANLDSKNTRSTSSILFSNGGFAVARDTREEDLAILGLEETTFSLPSKISLGVGLGSPNKWFAGVNYTSLSTSKLNNRTFANPNVSYTDATQYAVGGFYIPKYNSLTSYFNRVTYRAGIRYQDTGLIIENENINEFGISFGMSLPVGPQFSNVNIGVEYGSRGTTNATLVKENFINLNISLSLNDKWFQKRKID